MEKIKRFLARGESSKLIQIVLGNFVMSFAYAKWMVPNEFINGGVTSISMILEKVTGTSVVVWTNTVTGSLLIVALLFLGKGNFLRSIVSSITYPLFFSMWHMLPFSVTIYPVVDLVLASVFIAFGYFSCIVSDSSVVGLDVIAMVIHKKYPQTNLALLIRYFNLAILGVGVFIYSIPSVIMGVGISFASTTILDKLLIKYRAAERVQTTQQTSS